MANDLNKVLLIGRMTRDPEFKSVNGSSVVNFSIANNRVYVTNGEKKEETHYFDCVAWGRLADILKQYAGKGKQVAIEGRLQQQSWETPEGKKLPKSESMSNPHNYWAAKDKVVDRVTVQTVQLLMIPA